MRRFIAVAAALAIGLALMTVAVADKPETNDLSDLRAAISEIVAAWNNGDTTTMQRYYLPETSFFLASGEILDTFDPLRYQAWFDAGGKVSVQLRHLDIKVYGNTAISTGYLVGTLTQPDSPTQQGPWRSSAIWVKMEGKWKTVHMHNSPLIGASSQ